MERQELNQRISTLLAKRELKQPGIAERNRIVAVYAVATAERLSLSAEALLEVRVKAELSGVHDDALLSYLRPHFRLDEIVRLCEKFVALRMEESEAVALAWLESDANRRFTTSAIKSLRAVQEVIQPIGT